MLPGAARQRPLRQVGHPCHADGAVGARVLRVVRRRAQAVERALAAARERPEPPQQTAIGRVLRMPSHEASKMYRLPTRE
ncbi:putative peptidoglycan-binding domain-containing protein [Micromonospora sp. C31]|uniref:putative peptidoglycan-binding domain-containing protein n=1 Tax=Micromonospora sp. C31 TaxID=2824876 RepID=UPI0035B4F3B0